MEQIANLYTTTLASGYTAGSGSMVMTSASGAPTVPTFSLSIKDKVTGLIKLIVTVTAVAGTTFSVTAETSDTNCVAGDIVLGTMQTLRSIPAQIQDWLGVGATSALPPTTGRGAAQAGQRFKVNDGPYDYIFNGSIWVPYINGIRTAIPNQTFSWINQGGASVATETSGAILLTAPASTGVNARVRVFTAPATPYKFQFIFVPLNAFGTFALAGVTFSDGTKLSIFAMQAVTSPLNAIHLTGAHYTNATTFSAGLTVQSSGYALGAAIGPVILGLADDGTNRTTYYYPDGYTEIQIFQETSTTFLTATELGFMYDDNAANLGGSNLLLGIDRLI